MVELPHTYDLITPLVVKYRSGSDMSSESVDRVTIERYPTVREIRQVAFEKEDFDKQTRAIALATGLHKNDVEALDSRDFYALSEIVIPLFIPPSERRSDG